MSLNWGSQPSKHWSNGHVDSSYSNRLKSPSIQRSQVIFMFSTPLSNKKMPLMWKNMYTKRKIAQQTSGTSGPLKIDGLLKINPFLQGDFVSPKLWRQTPWISDTIFYWKIPLVSGSLIQFLHRDPREETRNLLSNLNSMYSEMVNVRMPKHPLIFIVKQHKCPTQISQPVFLNLCFFPGTLQ